MRQFDVKVRSFNMQDYQRNNNVSFKSDDSFDVGASSRRASEKAQVFRDDGTLAHQVERTYINDTVDGFESSDDFGTKYAKSVINIHKAAIKFINDTSDKVLKRLVVFLPGPIYKKNDELFARTANLKDKKGKGLTDINMYGIRSELIKMGKENPITTKDGNEISMVSSDLEFKPVKDAVGSAVGAGIALVQAGYADKLQPGHFVTVIMPGGGCTIADLMPLDDKIFVKTTESAYNVSAQRIDNHIARLGDVGATAKTVIRNYANCLGISDKNKIKTLQDLGKAEIATLDTLKIKIGYDETSSAEEISTAKTFEEAAEILEETGAYKKENIGSGKDKIAVLTVKDDADSQNTVKEARLHTFNLYCQAIAEAIILKNNEEINTIVLTGPLTHGIDAAIRADSKYYNNKVKADDNYYYREDGRHITPTAFNKRISHDSKDQPEITCLKDLVLAKVDRYIGEHTTPNMLAENDDFEVICDDNIKVADNTVAGKALLDERSQQVSTERSNWWVIPRDVLGLKN